MKMEKFQIVRVNRKGKVIEPLKGTYFLEKAARKNMAQLARIRNWHDLEVIPVMADFVS